MNLIKSFLERNKKTVATEVAPSLTRKDLAMAWVFKDLPENETPINPNDYTMIGEPIVTLVESLQKNHKRFKIEELTFNEYAQVAPAADVYDWMLTGNIRFYKFTDTKSQVTKTLVAHDKRVYRVDDLEFRLNGWELRVLYLAFQKVKLRSESVKRLRRMRCSVNERARREELNAENIAREVYAAIFE